MVNSKLVFLVIGLLIIFISGIFMYKAEVFSSYHIGFYLLAFLIIFVLAIDSQFKLSIKYLAISWIVLIVVGFVIAKFLASNHGTGLLGSYFNIYFLLYFLSPLIIILLMGIILKVVMSVIGKS